MRRTSRTLLATSIAIAVVSAASCERNEKPERSTFYQRQIEPIINASCTPSSSLSACHQMVDDRGNVLGNLDLTSYANLNKRRDLLVKYGPYGEPGLLLKVLPPYQIRLTSWDDSEPRFVTTDIGHAGFSPLDFSAQSYIILSQWIEGGATENNAPPDTVEYEFAPCSATLGRDALFDPNVEPSSEDYAQFASKVNPVLTKNCAAGNCHGSPANSLYLTCGETEEQKRWNYFAAGDYVSTTTQNSEILRRGLEPSQGGTYHEGGTIFTSINDPDYQSIQSWAELKGGPTNVPTDPGFFFFESRVQPMLVKRGCMMLGCHSPTMFHDYRLRGGSGGHFGLPASRTNYELSLEQLALEAPNVNSSRLVKKNLLLEEGGILHRGGSLFGSGGDPSACDAEAATNGPLDEQDPYCVISTWFELEKAERMQSALGLTAIVYVRRPPHSGHEAPQDYADFTAGAEVVRHAVQLGVDGSLTLTSETSLSQLCGLDPTTSQARRPAVSWDGQRIAFSARTGADAAYRIYVVEADGSCQVEPTIDRTPTLDSGDPYDDRGELIHNFDPAFASDGRIVFTSTRGNTMNVERIGYHGPTRTPADPSKLNANLYVLEDGNVRQLTFLLNQELTPAFMRDGRIIMVAEKRATNFYQLAGRRMNLDGGDYHPLFGQRSSIDYNQFTDVVELADKNLAAILSDRGASHGAGALAIINRSIGVDQLSSDPADYLHDPAAMDWPNPDFYQKSVRLFDRRATGKLEGTQGAFRNPSPLPDGRLLVSYDADVTNLASFNSSFDIAIADPSSGELTILLASDRDLVWPVAVYARPPQKIFESRPDEANANTFVYNDERRDRSQVTFLDLPLLASLLFQNTRSRRLIPDGGLVEVWENLPPEPGVVSFDTGGQFVDTDEFGQYYLRRHRLGVPQLYEDGSARIVIDGGAPITLAVTTDLAGEAEPRLHFQREEMQFYPGEYAHQSFRREFFNGLCGGCHGSLSGLETDIAANPDVLTRASEVIAASRNPTNLREGGTIQGPPFD